MAILWYFWGLVPWSNFPSVHWFAGLQERWALPDKGRKGGQISGECSTFILKKQLNFLITIQSMVISLYSWPLKKITEVTLVSKLSLSLPYRNCPSFQIQNLSMTLKYIKWASVQRSFELKKVCFAGSCTPRLSAPEFPQIPGDGGHF